ncbi:hypothetical protein [Companilactobacillus ginsenosidimutans]|uniref:SAM-dependent methyltransferase n=1 Tax=Companilactobacillus ginsenosidimutans TaxID=1007676 RepID=A0A0H4QHU9_9LACO|nr:hypothetical protein [Companilactobacillus ginsenosidimutans]AKP66596.1 hypothetical protein ABM34_02860 [Companilactobacillus ginsenosidimutans]
MDYINNLREIVSTLPQPKVFNARINFMQHVVEALKAGELPKYRFPQFELTTKDIERYLQSNMILDQDKFQQMVDTLQLFDKQLSEFRTYLQSRFGYWATITQSLMKEWSLEFPDGSYLELMGGNGYITRGFNDNGIESVCTDNLSWSNQSQTGHQMMSKVEKMDALSALDIYGPEVNSVVLAWSPDRNEIDYEILQKIRKTNLNFFVIGEKYGATNSRRFWENAEEVNDERINRLNDVYSTYDLVHDKIFLIH